MQSVLDIDAKSDDFKTLLSALTAKPTLFEYDIQRLRHAFYREAPIDRRCAAEVFHANRTMGVRHDAWTEFYLEALADFFLEYQRHGTALSAEAETVLLAWLGEDEPILDLGERRLILRIYLKASSVSEDFERRLLDAVMHNFFHHSERWLGGAIRSAGVIDALDLQLIRRLVRDDGVHHPRDITCAGAAFLLEIERNALRFAEPESWRRILIKALAQHLVSQSQLDSEPDPNSDHAIAGKLDGLLKGNHAPEMAARLGDDIRLAASSMMSATDQGRSAVGRRNLSRWAR